MPERLFLGWPAFEIQIETLQALCQASAEALPSPHQYLLLLEELLQQLQIQMSDRSGYLSLGGSGQRHVTELHRLLRLSLTDAALYQSAKSETLQQQRLKQLCDRLFDLRQRTQAILALL